MRGAPPGKLNLVWVLLLSSGARQGEHYNGRSRLECWVKGVHWGIKHKPQKKAGATPVDVTPASIAPRHVRREPEL